MKELCLIVKNIYLQKTTLTDEEVEDIVEVMDKTQILKIFLDKTIKIQLIMYLELNMNQIEMVEKNRSGNAMEDIV